MMMQILKWDVIGSWAGGLHDEEDAEGSREG